MKGKMCDTAIVIVTYNSEKVLPRCMESIANQTIAPKQLILSDTGSNDRSTLEKYRKEMGAIIIDAGKEAGFCRGNNAALAHIDPSCRYLLLLNPDAFLFDDFLEKATSTMERNKECAISTGTLYGYDIENNSPSGRYDSRGIFHTWYGKWYDRDQKKEVGEELFSEEELPAACGALLIIRREALQNDDFLFDPSFYMYKEDIELSLRLRKRGWKILYNPDLKAYHCRGWKAKRGDIERKYRLASAKNELSIHLRYRYAAGVLYSSLKFLAVKYFDC